MKSYFILLSYSDPPGPVDNSKICQVKNGIPSLLMNSDYAQMSDVMWTLLRDAYGGGPEVLIRPAATPTTCSNMRLDDGTETATVAAKPDSTTEK